MLISVYLDLYGRFNFKALVDDGTEEDRKNLDEYFDYVDTKAACDSAANNGGDGIVVILDWDGFSVSSYGSLSGTNLNCDFVDKGEPILRFSFIFQSVIS